MKEKKKHSKYFKGLVKLNLIKKLITITFFTLINISLWLNYGHYTNVNNISETWYK